MDNIPTRPPMYPLPPGDRFRTQGRAFLGGGEGCHPAPMVWVARNQGPWVLGPLVMDTGLPLPAALDRVLDRRFKEHSIAECLLLAGADHGFWAEMRVCRARQVTRTRASSAPVVL